MEGAFWDQWNLEKLDQDEAEQEEAGQEEAVGQGQQAGSGSFKEDMIKRINDFRNTYGEQNRGENNIAQEGDVGFENGTVHRIIDILDHALEYLRPGFVEPKPGSGRFVSADGTRVFRMGSSDILGLHGGGPHVNFERLEPNRAKPGKMMVVEDIHIYLED